MGSLCSTDSTTSKMATPTDKQAEVILAGCGAPKRGMGWYHAVQLLKGKCPSAVLCHVIEPWFLGGGAEGPGGPEFAEWAKEVEAEHGVKFHKSFDDLPAPASGVKRLCLVSGRTADNPRILGEAIKHGCTTIYLEKPGASTAAVTVLMAYNKNVCKFVTNAREFAATVEDSHTTFVSNNTYEPTAESLGECFERNSEGMLKNMAIHELALLVSFYDVAVDNIESVTADKEFSSMQTLKGPSGKDFTDFDKIKFTIKTKTGKEVSVQADRCGGDTSYATVSDSTGAEVFRHSMPDEEDEANVLVLQAKYPGAMPYFFSQDPDYITVKDRVGNFCANGVEAAGVATIEIACETLKVAEYLTPTLREQLAEYLTPTLR